MDHNVVPIMSLKVEYSNLLASTHLEPRLFSEIQIIRPCIVFLQIAGGGLHLRQRNEERVLASTCIEPCFG